jgi:hypothetical protein
MFSLIISFKSSPPCPPIPIPAIFNFSFGDVASDLPSTPLGKTTNADAAKNSRREKPPLRRLSGSAGVSPAAVGLPPTASPGPRPTTVLMILPSASTGFFIDVK